MNHRRKVLKYVCLAGFLVSSVAIGSPNLASKEQPMSLSFTSIEIRQLLQCSQMPKVSI